MKLFIYTSYHETMKTNTNEIIDIELLPDMLQKSGLSDFGLNTFEIFKSVFKKVLIDKFDYYFSLNLNKYSELVTVMLEQTLKEEKIDISTKSFCTNQELINLYLKIFLRIYDTYYQVE